VAESLCDRPSSIAFVLPPASSREVSRVIAGGRAGRPPKLRDLTTWPVKLILRAVAVVAVVCHACGLGWTRYGLKLGRTAVATVS
jgi:hypothetical protein